MTTENAGGRSGTPTIGPGKQAHPLDPFACLARQQRNAAFTSLYHEAYPDLVNFAARRIGRDLAPDAVSEAFVVLLGRWNAGRTHECDSLRASAFCAVRWTSLHELRDATRPHDIASRLAFAMAPHGLPDEPSTIIAATDHVQELLATLSPTERRAIEMTVLHGWTGVEAATELGSTQAAINAAKRRALVHLRDVLGSIGTC